MSSQLTYSEGLVLSLLQSDPSVTYTFEELIRFLPELHWSAIFTAVDHLSRRGAIEMHRKGFDYILRSAGTASECSVGV